MAQGQGAKRGGNTMSDPTDALIEAATMAREHGMTSTECRAVIRDVSNAPWLDDVLLGKAKKKNAPAMGPAGRLSSVKQSASLQQRTSLS